MKENVSPKIILREMGLKSLAPDPRTTVRAVGHKIYPYLLRDVEIVRPNHGVHFCTIAVYDTLAEIERFGIQRIPWLRNYLRLEEATITINAMSCKKENAARNCANGRRLHTVA